MLGLLTDSLNSLLERVSALYQHLQQHQPTNSRSSSRLHHFGRRAQGHHGEAAESSPPSWPTNFPAGIWEEEEERSLVGHDHQLLPVDVDNVNNVNVVHTIVEYRHVFVPDMAAVLAAPYYWGAIDRWEAEALLDGAADGTFLLRDSGHFNQLFSVSFRRYQRTLHARIEQLDGRRFSFDIHDPTVASEAAVTALVKHYGDAGRCLFFEPQLLRLLPRPFVFSLQELCRATIVGRCAYERVDELRALLPAHLRHFLRRLHYKQPVRSRAV